MSESRIRENSSTPDYSSYFDALLRTLCYVASTQSQDHGWAWRPGQVIGVEPTAHVLIPMSELGWHEPRWLRRAYHQMEKMALRGDFPWWMNYRPYTSEPTDLMDWVHTLMASQALLNACHKGFHLESLLEDDLRRSVFESVKAFLRHKEEWINKCSWWLVQVAASALYTADPTSPLWDGFFQLFDAITVSPEAIAETGEGDLYKESAHACIALLLMPGDNSSWVSHVVDFLVQNFVPVEQGGWWPTTMTPDRGPDPPTRAVILALERFALATGDISRIQLPARKGLLWLLSQQNTDGTWLSAVSGRPYQAPALGYRVLIIELALELGILSAPDDHTSAIQRRLHSMGKPVYYCARRGAPCSQQISPSPKLIFVLMPFEKEFTNLYHLAIRPSAQQAGFSVQRADEIVGSTEIWCGKICKTIQEARLVIADITHANANVFYELGVCHGVEKEVLLIAQQGKSLPFDISTVRVEQYDPDDLPSFSARLSSILQDWK